MASLPRSEGSDRLFPDDLTSSRLSYFWHIVREDVRIHDLRHTFASEAVMGGESLPMVGRILGHTQAQTTARYAHLADDPLRKASERVASSIQQAMHR